MFIIKVILIMFWLISAGIPADLWQDFINVAYCESRMTTDVLGDGGTAKGLMQIHWDFWIDWASENNPDFVTKEWNNPIHNLELAYLIQEEYSLPRNQDRWEQWSAKPTFRCR